MYIVYSTIENILSEDAFPALGHKYGSFKQIWAE